ncbi:MAG: glycosyltransferase family 9 protein [Planctomycetota bacterium]|nr:glycosyltransferase family 9 protein [Planctomycetota bacterium]
MSEPRTTPLPGELERLLVIAPTWLGDTVMATPVLRAIRHHRPETQIIVATRRGLGAVLAGAPFVDELIELDMQGLLGPLRAAGAIRGKRPRAILLLPNSFRSALTARLSGTPIRIGYRRDGRGMLLTHGLRPERADRPTPAPVYYARLGAFALGGGSIDTRMELFVSDEESAAGEALLADVDGPFVLFVPGASKREKRWPAERFARVADALRASRGLRCLITGTPAERDVIDAVSAAAAGPVIDLSRRGVTLGSLKAVIRRAKLMITNDTGPRHIAAAFGTPTVSLFGPTDPRWTALPQAHERVVLAEPFLPEELIADRFAKLCAIDRIVVSDVLAAAEALLDASASSGR